MTSSPCSTCRLEMTCIQIITLKIRNNFSGIYRISISQIKKLGTERPGDLPKVTQPAKTDLGWF